MKNRITMGRSRRAIATAAVAAGVLALAACSSAGDPSATASASGGGVVSDAPTTLTIATGRQPTTFDPINLSEGLDGYIWTSIYDTLFVKGPEGEFVNHAATSWDMSEDGLTVTIGIREDLVFSDGTPVTSADLKATLDYERETPGAGQGQVAAIASVDIVDDYTVTLHLSQPDPVLQTHMAGRVGIIAKAGAMEDESYGLNPIGSGPYTLNVDETTQGATYVLDKRDDHWNASTYPFEKVTVRVIQDPTALENGLRAGELDIATIQPTSRDSLQSSGVEIVELPATTQVFLVITDREGTIQPALADVRVRQALNMAFDREAIVTAALGGVGQPTGQTFYPTSGANVPELDDVYGYDVEGAKALLTEAGYPNGFTMQMPSIVYTTAMEPIITQALADIGVTVEWVPIPPQDTVTAVTSGAYPVVAWFDGVSIAAETAQGHFDVNGFLNPLHNEDPELTSLFEAARAESDLDAVNEIYKDINRWTVENAWEVPIAFNNSLIGVRDGYAYVGTAHQQYSTLLQFGVAS